MHWDGDERPAEDAAQDGRVWAITQVTVWNGATSTVIHIASVA